MKEAGRGGAYCPLRTEAAVARVLRPKTAEGEWSLDLWCVGAMAPVNGGDAGRATPPEADEVTCSLA